MVWSIAGVLRTVRRGRRRGRYVEIGTSRLVRRGGYVDSATSRRVCRGRYAEVFTVLAGISRSVRRDCHCPEPSHLGLGRYGTPRPLHRVRYVAVGTLRSVCRGRYVAVSTSRREHRGRVRRGWYVEVVTVQTRVVRVRAGTSSSVRQVRYDEAGTSRSVRQGRHGPEPSRNRGRYVEVVIIGASYACRIYSR